MELLKCHIEASNSTKRADDSTIDLCFDKMITNVFGDKRGLIKYLLTPYHKLNKDQIIQIKNIFNNEFKRLMEAENEESDDEDMDMDNGRVVPTLTNISEHVQVHITSFLDFPSIKELSVVSSSISPIALSQFSQIDMKLCNVHQLSNGGQYVKNDQIIGANTKTYRVRRYENVKRFVEKIFDIAPDNLLTFEYFSKKQLYHDFIESNFDHIAAEIKDLSNTYSVIIGDKTKMNVIENNNDFPQDYNLMIIQEFNVTEQTLKIQQIVRSNTKITVEGIKNMIPKDDVSMFRLVDAFDAFDPHNTLGETIYELERLSADSEISFYELTRSSIIYQDELLTDEEYTNIQKSYHQKLEPFCADFAGFYEMQKRERIVPGTKYILLVKALREKGFDGAEIVKCYEKACTLNDDFIAEYLGALNQIEDTEIMKNIILRKTEEAILSDYCLWQMHEIIACIYRTQNDFDMALVHFFKSIEILQRILAKQESKEMKLKLCETYYNIADIYEVNEEMESRLSKAKECYEKILKMFPNSACYRKVYCEFLYNYEKKCEDALNELDRVIDIIETDNDETNEELEITAYSCRCRKFECLIEMKKHKEAEETGHELELLEANDDEIYCQIVELYKKYQNESGPDRYVNLASELRKKGVNAKVIAYFCKIAYDLYPDDPVFIHKYVVALYDAGENDEEVQRICLERLELHEKGKMEIDDNYVWELYKIAGDIYYTEQKFYDLALEYYEKSIGIVHNIMANDSEKNMNRSLCELYYREIQIYHKSSISMQIDYETMGRENYEKILELAPNSAFYLWGYVKILRQSEMSLNSEEALKRIDYALLLLEENKDETPEYECSLYDCYREKFKCLMELKEYKKAEAIALKLIEIKPRSDKYLKRLHEKIIDLNNNDSDTFDDAVWAQMEVKIEEIVRSEDLNTLTNRQVKDQLKACFDGINIKIYKSHIKDKINAVAQTMMDSSMFVDV